MGQQDESNNNAPPATDTRSSGGSSSWVGVTLLVVAVLVVGSVASSIPGSNAPSASPWPFVFLFGVCGAGLYGKSQGWFDSPREQRLAQAGSQVKFQPGQTQGPRQRQTQVTPGKNQKGKLTNKNKSKGNWLGPVILGVVFLIGLFVALYLKSQRGAPRDYHDEL